MIGCSDGLSQGLFSSSFHFVLMLLLCQFGSTNRYMNDGSDLNLRKELIHVKKPCLKELGFTKYFSSESKFICFFQWNHFRSHVLKVRNLYNRALWILCICAIAIDKWTHWKIYFTEFEIRKKGIMHTQWGKKQRFTVCRKYFMKPIYTIIQLVKTLISTVSRNVFQKPMTRKIV